jgi:gluconate 2-dehydrogenase alpha chain
MIPEAEASHNFTVLPETRVFRVDRDAEGLASGVSYFDASGQLHEQPARLVILSAYSLENVRLLLLSRLNANRAVGKYFMTHNYVWVKGIFEDKFSNPFIGPITGPSMMDLNSDNFDHSEVGFLWGALVSLLAGDTRPIDGAMGTPPDVPTWGKYYKEWIRKYYRRSFGIIAECTPLPYSSNFLDLDPRVKDRWGIPVIRITHDWYENDKRMARFMADKMTTIAKEMGATRTWLANLISDSHINIHEVGGTRMGIDPKTTVVNKYSQAHEVPNFFVLGGSVFPTYCGLEPTETIQALAFMTADYIKREVHPGGSLARYT